MSKAGNEVTRRSSREERIRIARERLFETTPKPYEGETNENGAPIVFSYGPTVHDLLKEDNAEK